MDSDKNEDGGRRDAVVDEGGKRRDTVAAVAVGGRLIGRCRLI